MQHLKPFRVRVHRPDMVYVPPKQEKRIGLGDVVAAVAQPIAKVIDAVAGTNLENCPGCKGRQAKLNKMLSDVKHPFKGGQP